MCDVPTPALALVTPPRSCQARWLIASRLVSDFQLSIGGPSRLSIPVQSKVLDTVAGLRDRWFCCDGVADVPRPKGVVAEGGQGEVLAGQLIDGCGTATQDTHRSALHLSGLEDSPIRPRVLVGGISANLERVGLRGIRVDAETLRGTTCHCSRGESKKKERNNAHHILSLVGQLQC